MDYRKLDAPLAHRASTEEDPQARVIPVLIRMAAVPSHDQLAILAETGVTRVAEGRKIVTACVSRQDLETLSQQSWIDAVSLSTQRYPVAP